MLKQRKRPAGAGDEPSGLELQEVEIPDVAEQLARLDEVANQAKNDKRAEKQAARKRQREREEVARCCGIRI